MSNTIDFEQQDKEYIANTYGRFNVCFEKGKGSLLWDVDGKEYIDLGSGIGVTAFGVDDDGIYQLQNILLLANVRKRIVSHGF